ncbi:MAG: hypothetical protein ACRDLB_08645 [Actinomycetota bacterium]
MLIDMRLVGLVEVEANVHGLDSKDHLRRLRGTPARSSKAARGSGASWGWRGRGIFIEIAIMRRISLLLAVASIFPSNLCPPPAIASEPALVIRGGRTAVVEIEFDETVKFEPREMRVNMDGGYAGYILVSRRDGSLVSGAVTLRALEKDKSEFSLLWPAVFASRRAKPGKYLLYLVTDGSAEIRISASELTKTITVTPKKPASSKSQLTEFSVLPHNEQRLSVRVGRNSLGIAILYQSVDNHQASVAEQCLTERGSRQCLVADSGGTIPVVSPGHTGGYVLNMAVLSPWSWVKPGRYDIVNRLTSANTGGEKFGLVLMLQMSG